MSKLIALVLALGLALGPLWPPVAFAQAAKEKVPAKTQAKDELVSKNVVAQATYDKINGQIIARQPAGRE